MAKEKFSLENLSQLSKKGMEREEEITEKLKQLPRLSKKAIAREKEITGRLKKLPELSKSKNVDGEFDFSDEDADMEREKQEPSTDTKEALGELRGGEKVKIREYEEKEERKKIGRAKKESAEEQKKLRKELAGEKFEEKREAGGGSEIKKHLRANLSDYPELLTPDVKKNFAVITKNENIIEKNEGNAKKSAQDKVKQAKEIIGRAREAVNDFADNLAEKYDESQNRLMELSRELFGEQKKPDKKGTRGGLENELNALYQATFGPDKAYSPEKKGLFSGIKEFFNDRKIKKAMGEDWDVFQEKEADYKQKLDAYNSLLASHGKKFGRLEETREADTTFRAESRGAHREKGHLA